MSQTAVAQYPTRGIWYGDLAGTIAATGPSYTCQGSFNGLIRAVVETVPSGAAPGDVSGDALVHGRVGGCSFPPGVPATGDVTFTVTGTFDGKLFNLQLAASGVENVAAWAVALHLFSLPDPPLSISAARITNDSIAADGTFHRENSGPEELAGGGAVAILDGRLSLSCCSPNAAPVQPAKHPPRFLSEND